MKFSLPSYLIFITRVLVLILVFANFPLFYLNACLINENVGFLYFNGIILIIVIFNTKYFVMHYKYAFFLCVITNYIEINDF